MCNKVEGKTCALVPYRYEPLSVWPHNWGIITVLRTMEARYILLGEFIRVSERYFSITRERDSDWQISCETFTILSNDHEQNKRYICFNHGGNCLRR